MSGVWTPSSPALSAETFVSTLQRHPFVAIHFWAPWNGYDREFDKRLARLREEFGTQIVFRSVNVDDAGLAAVCVTAPVLNVPALGIWRHGLRDRVLIGLRDEDSLRRILEEAVRPTGIPASEAGR